MKRYILILVLAAVSLLAGTSCRKETLSKVSVIKDSSIEMNDFDYWLEENFLKPYNIEFMYRFSLNESDKGYWTVPADIDASIIYAHLVKYLCVDTYDEVAGVDFTRAYFPKMFFLIGEWEYRNNGSFILGTAEGGKKIMLSGVNYIPLIFREYSGEELEEQINYYYIKTIHHEFTHIINQTKAFPETFQNVTPATYVADACFDTDEFWLGRGYITAYAQSEPREDFAELLSEYITHSESWWTEQLSIANTQTANVRESDPEAPNGSDVIKSKIDIVRDYMKTDWDVDIDELRATVGRRTADVVAGRVDLSDISI